MVSPGLLHTRELRRWTVTLQFGCEPNVRKIASIEDAPTALQAAWAAKERAQLDGASLSGFQVDLALEQP